MDLIIAITFYKILMMRDFLKVDLKIKLSLLMSVFEKLLSLKTYYLLILY